MSTDEGAKPTPAPMESEASDQPLRSAPAPMESEASDQPLTVHVEEGNLVTTDKDRIVLTAIAGAVCLLLIGVGAGVGITFGAVQSQLKGSQPAPSPPAPLPPQTSCQRKFAEFKQSQLDCPDAADFTHKNGMIDVIIMLYAESNYEDLAPLKAALGDLADGEAVLNEYGEYLPGAVGLEGYFTPDHIEQMACDVHVESVAINCGTGPADPPTGPADAPKLSAQSVEPEALGGLGFPQCNQQCLAGGTQSTPSGVGLWGLDRMDQRSGRNARFVSDPRALGEGTIIYVMDTGMRTDHEEHTGRVETGWSAGCSTGTESACGRDFGYQGFIGNGRGQASPRTCSNHGEFVASNAAGTTLGLAKRARIVPVQVMNCA